eukprot:5149784-Amphidinium_carterae.1
MLFCGAWHFTMFVPSYWGAFRTPCVQADSNRRLSGFARAWLKVHRHCAASVPVIASELIVNPAFQIWLMWRRIWL